MIHLSTPLSNSVIEKKLDDTQDWKKLLQKSRLTTEELLDKIGLASHPLANSEAERLFELRVPPAYLEKIEYGNPNDPLLLQILPQSVEFNQVEGYQSSPLEEEQFSPVKGLIHKYQSRVLLIANQTCAIHCRYCFRRHFPYDEHRQAQQEWQHALDYISKHPAINEVILSGGDPLTLNNNYLVSLLEKIDAMPQIKRIRLHTRLLTSLPQRIDDELVAGLSRLSTKLIIVMHTNHPNEFGEDVEIAINKLKPIDITLLNQSVLLKGVNDDAQTLCALSETLFQLGITPYYLFTLDKVAGASHFDLPLEQAQAIYQELLALLPGFLVPKLAKEVPGELSKSPIGVRLP